MKKVFIAIALIAAFLSFNSCKEEATTVDNKKEAAVSKTSTDNGDFNWEVDTFADLRVLRYQIPDFDKLSLRQKKLVYYLTQAGYEGRDIAYDQNYFFNLKIRKALENIYKNYKGDKTSDNWKNFMVYLKRIWFSNGIHHHYSNDKIMPKFPRDYFLNLLAETKTKLDNRITDIMFDPNIDNKKVSLDPSKDLLLNSAVNFYANTVSQKDVEKYYEKIIDKNDPTPISYGLNSRLYKDDLHKTLKADVYRANGLYGSAIKKIISWLEKAKTVAENEKQKEGFDLLIKYYKTGDLKAWDEYNVHWVQNTDVDIDYINSFIEVYNDPIGYRGSYESIIEIRDFEATKRMKTLGENAQWFEDNSPIMDSHKKGKVVGITYKVVNVAGESGDASPSTPIGVNLPNANWIRSKYGSKSVSLGNLIAAYFNAPGGGTLEEFANSDEEIDLEKKYGNLADKLTTALHEVIGHASGKLNPGVGTPKETLKNYASTLEEARADIVALYYIMDPHMIELGLMDNLDVGKAAYDGYIGNGLLKQLKRIEPGRDIEEAHMRNRQLICNWALEKGKKDNIIERYQKEGKTFFKINDYDKLRKLFGILLRDIQKIKSEGDYAAGKKLVETYGVKVDKELHKEVLQRVKKLNTKPYSGFVNPNLIPVTDKEGNITDIKIENPNSFEEQMIYYSEKYGNL